MNKQIWYVENKKMHIKFQVQLTLMNGSFSGTDTFQTVS